MPKGTKLSELEKGEVTALKRDRKSQREMALGRSKTVICNYLKVLNKYGTRKPTGRLKELSPRFKRRIVREVKKKKKKKKFVKINAWMLLAILEQFESI